MIRIAMFNALFDLIVLIVIVYLANTRMRLTEKCEATWVLCHLLMVIHENLKFSHEQEQTWAK